MPENTDNTMELEKDASGGSIISPFKTETYAEVLNWWFRDPRTATLGWVIFCVIYWGVLVLLPSIIDNDLSSSNFIFWIIGMIGVCGVYYCVKAGHPADSPAGKPIVAFTCLLMSCDWISSAYRGLNGDFQFEGQYFEPVLMFCHSLAMLWASLFFYNRAVKAGQQLAWLTLLIEWIDLMFMCIAILVIQNQNETCLDSAICWAYFIVLSLDLLLWFFPIMLGFSDTERYIHLHMVILDCCTDLPLICVLVFSPGALSTHWFLFIDIAVKLILLLRSIAYHGIYSLALKQLDKDGDGEVDATQDRGAAEGDVEGGQVR